MEIQVVLHKCHGGFGFSLEMAEWFRDNKGWEIVRDLNQAVDRDKVVYISGTDFGIVKDMNTLEFRQNPDLIQCIEELREKHKDDDISVKRKNMVFKLSIDTIKVKFEIEPYNDGYERAVPSVTVMED